MQLSTSNGKIFKNLSDREQAWVCVLNHLALSDMHIPGAFMLIKKFKTKQPPSLKSCLKTASATIVYVTLQDIVKFRDRLRRIWKPTPFEKESLWWLDSFLCFVLDLDTKSKRLQVSEDGKFLLQIPCLKSGLTLSGSILKASFTPAIGLAFPH